ncbi:hypothetical protein NT01EI_0251 [Edwardsiella ictaluri 93-146]|uniref:Uncharacterized protein n=1 Tax=Edwardsiella ictaluri (strain 93-146) TaxID=634503 RepID=C5BCD1_EDWI9|nr:hypothetical protein NT01EI_0251 [Edwardsiella ictaluri 93-146]STP86807.1 Uncharacterised protein [Edwardsiella ictaluri]
MPKCITLAVFGFEDYEAMEKEQEQMEEISCCRYSGDR